MKLNLAESLKRLVLGLLGAFLLSPCAQADSPDPVRILTAHLVPYSIQAGAQKGFMVELVEELERRLGSNRAVNFYPWARAQVMAQREPDRLIFPLTRTPEREPYYNWLIKVAPIEMAFMSIEGVPLTLEQARGLERISVQQNTPFEQFLLRQGFTNVVALEDPAVQHLHLLKHGRSQAWFTAVDLASYALIEHQFESPLVVSPSYYLSDVYIATSKHFSSSLAADYRRIYQQMVEDGSYAQIMKSYRRP